MVFAGPWCSLPCLEHHPPIAPPDTTGESALEFAAVSSSDGVFKPTLNQMGVPLEFSRTRGLTGTVHRSSGWTGYRSVVWAADIFTFSSDLGEGYLSGRR